LSIASQTSLSSFEPQRPILKGKSAELNALVRALGISRTEEPRPAERGYSWQDDSAISTPHFRRDPDDRELAFFFEDRSLCEEE
jgi:hypothetical protein